MQESWEVIMRQNVHLREAQTAAQVPGRQVTSISEIWAILSQSSHFWPKKATFGLKKGQFGLFWGSEAKNGYFWPKMANFGPFGPLQPKIGFWAEKKPVWAFGEIGRAHV